MNRIAYRFVSAMIVFTLLGHSSFVKGAKPTVGDALKLSPIQKDVDYDIPSKAEQPRCTISLKKNGKATAWEVRGETGQLLRRFVDTNGDNKLDRWSYYKDGIEVYRDIDINFNNKADQYRWLGTAGTRWGIDSDENRQINYWKTISAEEVSAEIVASLRDRDVARFQRLLLTSKELASLGLSKEKASQLKEKILAAKKMFPRFAQSQKIVGKNSRWVNFGATQPGIVPAGSDGIGKDLVVYENVAAIVSTQDSHGQLNLGTLIQVGSCWRAVDLPTSLDEQQANAAGLGFFFQASFSRHNGTLSATSLGLDQQTQKLIQLLEKIDQSLAGTTSTKRLSELNSRRADLLEKLAQSSANGQDRDAWIRQLADTVSAAVQSGNYPTGVRRLQTLHESLAKKSNSSKLTGYIKYRWMMADYAQKLENPQADFSKIQENWLKNLEKFVTEFPRNEEAAEAMLQLAFAQEFAGEDKLAKKWYRQIVSSFPSTSIARKAQGANSRLSSVGKTIRLQGRTLDGKTVDLAKYRGKVVLLHYWASWSEPCLQDLKIIQRLYAKYGARGFAPVGVNLDNDSQELRNVIRKMRLAWPQLHESGGTESRLANELGISTLPMMLLLDRQGRVIHRDLHSNQLEAELRKQIR